ncbi:MAG: hypothetical protein ABSG43_08705 [Solirubrobacteraceae bacterium]|jgi:hypothetical protein
MIARHAKNATIAPSVAYYFASPDRVIIAAAPGAEPFADTAYGLDAPHPPDVDAFVKAPAASAVAATPAPRTRRQTTPPPPSIRSLEHSISF